MRLANEACSRRRCSFPSAAGGSSSSPPPLPTGTLPRPISGRVYDDRAQRTSERLARLHVLEARLAQLTSLSAEEDAAPRHAAPPLPPSALATLTSTRLARDADDGCCVCLDLMPANADVLHLPCSHFFHARCVREWLAVSASCPLCKTAVEIRRGALEVRAEERLEVHHAAYDLEPEFFGHAWSGRAVHVRTAEGGVLSAPTASFGARTPSAPASTVCAIM